MDQAIEPTQVPSGIPSGRPAITATATRVIAKLVNALGLMAVAALFILVTIEVVA